MTLCQLLCRILHAGPTIAVRILRAVLNCCVALVIRRAQILVHCINLRLHTIPVGLGLVLDSEQSLPRAAARGERCQIALLHGGRVAENQRT